MDRVEEKIYTVAVVDVPKEVGDFFAWEEETRILLILSCKFCYKETYRGFIYHENKHPRNDNEIKFF